MDITVPHGFIPRPYQLELFQAMEGIGRKQVKRAFLRWHRRAGKDFCCLAYMFYTMFKRKGSYFYFLPNYAQARKIIWEGINKDGFKFLDMMPKELIERINNQEMMMQLKNGSVLRLIGTDNIDSIVGTNPVGCVFSEYSLQDPTAWNFIRPILAENGGYAIFNGTPRGKNHMYDMDLKVSRMDSWYCSVLQTLWPEKPNYSGIVKEHVIDEERQAGMDEDTVEQEFGVSYAAGVKGAYYADLIDRARDEGRIGMYSPSRTAATDTYWDLGRSDDTVIWFVQRSGNSLQIVDYHEEGGQSIEHFADVLYEKGYNYRTHYLPWDATMGRIETRFTCQQILGYALKEHRISDDIVIAPKLKVQQGIDMVRTIFHRLYFNDQNCADGLKKLALYHRRFDHKRQVFLQQPVHDFASHAADALRTLGVCELHDNGPQGRVGPVRPIRIISNIDVDEL